MIEIGSTVENRWFFPGHNNIVGFVVDSHIIFNDDDDIDEARSSLSRENLEKYVDINLLG